MLQIGACALAASPGLFKEIFKMSVRGSKWRLTSFEVANICEHFDVGFSCARSRRSPVTELNFNGVKIRGYTHTGECRPFNMPSLPPNPQSRLLPYMP